MEIKGSNINFNQKIKDELKKGGQLAKEIMLFADNHTGAVSKTEFQEKLKKLGTLSAQELVSFIRTFDKEESIIELICDEVGNYRNTKKDACQKVINALLATANGLGINTDDFGKLFANELENLFGKDNVSYLEDKFYEAKSKYINTDKLDSIVNALTQAIENRQNFSIEDIKTVKNTSATEGFEKSNKAIEAKLEEAFAAFGERVGEDGEMTDVKETLINLKTKEKTEVKYDGQMQQDGIAADIADAISKIWGSENTADKVRADLKEANSQLRMLERAKEMGEDAYKITFKEIFGVEYDYANVYAYEKAEKTYIEAKAHHEFELSFNRKFKTLLSPAPLRDETETISPDPSTNILMTNVTATKEMVFNRELNNLTEMLGKDRASVINQAFESAGVANGTMEEKFEVLKTIATNLSKNLHTNTLNACNGKEFAEVQTMYDNSYKAAYGVENDIIKRVTDYNTSQKTGALFVKIGGTALLTIATAGGAGLGAASLVAASSTIGAEVIDRGTSGRALNTLNEEGVGAYIKTSLGDIDWEATLKQAAIAGSTVYIAGKIAQGVTFLMHDKTPIAQAVAMFGADVVTDAGIEYVMTGKITVENMVFTVLLSAAGNIIAIKQLSATGEAGKANFEASVKSSAKKYDLPVDVVQDMMQKHSDIVDKLMTYTTPDGKALFDAKDISHILYNCKSTIENAPEQIFAILNNAEEVAYIMKYKNRAAGLWRAIGEPLNSTLDANPAAFGVKPKANVNIDDFKAKFNAARSTNDLEALVRSAKTTEELDVIINGLTSKDIIVNRPIIESIVDDAMNKKRILTGTGSQVVENVKNGFGEIKKYDNNGNLIETRSIFGGQIDNVIKYAPNGDWLPTKDSRGAWYKIKEAGFTPEVVKNLKAQSDFYGPELVDEVLDMIVYLEDQVAAGKPITKELIEGAIDLYSPGASGGSAYTQRSMIANTWNRGDDVFRAYGQTPPVKATPTTPATSTTDFATKLADVKGPDGQPFLTKTEIDNLLENCQHEFVTDGKPIPDFEARIMAVLSNPEEIASLADWKSRSAGVWRAIQDPLQSTVDLNPAAFGVKPKAAVPRQTAPSQKLPDVVDKIYGGKAEAEAVVFGNGTLADINPSIVENATEELTKYFGREIKANDLQVVRNSNGAYISYFDPETGLATTFSNSGKLNGQFKIEFDAQGNIQSFDLETIYADGKFWLR